MSSHDLLAMAFDKSPRRSDAEQNQTIMNRAIEIGMDPFKDSKLFWIAEQSLKAKLPDEWVECTADGGQIYYFNLRNEDSTWEHPTLEHYRQMYAKVKKQQEVDARIGKRDLSSLPDIEPSSGRSTASDSRVSPRGVAASTLKKKRDAEKLGGDATFWRTRYDLMESEKDKVEHQARKLEKDLQENLLQGARLIESNHKLKTLAEDCGGKLRVSCSKIIKHLAKRGFKIDPRKGIGDVDLQAATDDMVAVVESHIEVDEGDRDENGFSLNWDGALARMKKELEFCFTYEGDAYTVDEVELKTKLLDMVAMVVSFGEYLRQESREDYTEIFIQHICEGAPGSTMVPLEVVSRSETVSRREPPGRADILLDPPHVVSNLRKELEEEKELTKQLGAEIDQKKHELEVMHTKLLGMQARLEDNRAHEDLMTSKFNALCKSLEDVKLVGSSSKGGDVVGLSAENEKFKKEIKSLNNQLNIANKRAVDAERRLEEAVEKESEMKSELTSLELNLRLKLDKKKAVIHELAEQKSDLEKVSKELYDELQNALLVSERIERDHEALKDVLDEYRAGDASVAVVREKLEIEYERSKTLEDKIDDLTRDLTTVEKAYRDIVKVNEKLEMQAMEMREEMAGMQYELDRQRNRTDVLTTDNLSLEETTRNLKYHIVKLNDHIVEIKGSIRVFCRVRPLFVDEIRDLQISEADLESLVRYPDYNMLDFNSCPFQFDRVFEPCISQTDVYDEVDPYVRSVMNGCRACIFAYGETGSGKTHTMEGTAEDPGVILRALKSVFQEMRNSTEFNTEVSMSVLEVYNENIKDLLSLMATDDPLEVRVGRNGTYIDGLSEWPIRCIEEAVSLMTRASNNRAMGHADPELHFTRSHIVHVMKVERLNVRNGQTLLGYLYMVDLAGSERVKLSTMSGKRLREAQTINKSLGSLGDVISSLASGHKHVPYRSSKLTFLLQDALKESSKVLMFININPSPVHTGESTNALQFGSHCRNVELGHAKRAVTYQVTKGEY